MASGKIKKRNLDESLLEYFRNTESKITYDDLDSEVVTDIKNMLASDTVNRYVKYNDFELRNKIQLLEKNKLNISDAIDDDLLAEKLETMNNSLRSYIRSEMLNYVKNERGTIPEYLLTDELKEKINSRFVNDRSYYVSYTSIPSGGGSGDGGYGDYSQVLAEVQAIKSNLLENTKKVNTNTENIKINKNLLEKNYESNKSEIDTIKNRLAFIEDDSSTNITSINDDIDKLISDVKTANDNISNNALSIAGLGNSITDVYSYVDNNYVSINDTIRLSQLDVEIRTQLESIRHTNVKITYDDLDNNLKETIRSGGGGVSNLSSLFNGENGQTYFTKVEEGKIPELKAGYIYENSVITINNTLLLNEYKAYCIENNISYLCNLEENIAYKHSSGDIWEIIGTASDMLAGKLFTLYPSLKLCFWSGKGEHNVLTDLADFATYEYIEGKYSTIEDNESIKSDIEIIKNNVSDIEVSMDSLVTYKYANEYYCTKEEHKSLQDTVSSIQDTLASINSSISTIQQRLRALETYYGGGGN